MDTNKQTPSDFRWIEFDDGCRTTPKWKKTIGVDEDGRVFLPVKLFGSENISTLRAVQNGQSMSCYKKNGRIFFSAEMLSLLFPAKRQLIEELRNKATEIINQNKGCDYVRR